MSLDRTHPLALLAEALRVELPSLQADLDPAESPGGISWLDLHHHEQGLAVQYRDGTGFGISSRTGEGYGEGADEYYEDGKDVLLRVVDLFRSGSRTEARRPKFLRKLRESRQMSQVELAHLLGVKQPSISKMESQDDWSLHTLRRYVAALGGVLEVKARFPEGTLELGNPSDTPPVSR